MNCNTSNSKPLHWIIGALRTVALSLAILAPLAASADIVLEPNRFSVAEDYSVQISIAVAAGIVAFLGMAYAVLVAKRAERDSPKLVPLKDGDKPDEGQGIAEAGR